MATNPAPVEHLSRRILVDGSAGLSLLAVVGAALAMMGAALAAQTVVPVRTVRLPDTPYEYANVPLPPHFQGAGAVDNTPADNPITNDGATLGRVLFYDTALSANGKTSCSSCHKQERAFADPNRVSRGFDGRFTDRHAMNLTGLRYYPRARFFWDDRTGNLEEMVLLPVRNPIEMGEDPARLPQKLAALSYYPDLFRRAFGDPAITEPRMARALAQFLRSLVSFRSRFDDGMARAHVFEDDFENFTRQENHGKALFVRSCASCHFAVQEIPFELASPANNGTELDWLSADGGFADITLNAHDAGRFKSPTLRNVEVAGPYMHNGSLATLEDVVEHYSRNFKQHPNLDFRMQPLNLTESEKAALVAFLKTLTDRAFLTDPRFSDPFDPPGATSPLVAPFAPAPQPKAPLPERGGVEIIIARVMSFDANGDGRVAAVELPLRMQEIVTRGDRNGDAALDREEVRAIASSSPVIGEGKGVPPVTRQIVVTVRDLRDPGVAGLIDDLKLPADRRALALAAQAKAEEDITKTLTASLETFRDEVRTLVTEEQFAALDKGIQKHGHTVREILSYAAAPCCRPQIPISAVEVDREMRALGLASNVLASVKAALDRHLERTFTLATDRSVILRRMTPALTAEELADFAASLDRHGAIVIRAEPPSR
jgi:cytochrome c peroxidase